MTMSRVRRLRPAEWCNSVACDSVSQGNYAVASSGVAITSSVGLGGVGNATGGVG
jgi:hypothetical protein